MIWRRSRRWWHSGQFYSDQAIHGTDILRKKYATQEFRRDRTYLWEILYPENRIVVNYGDRRDLVLLAVINTASGLDGDAEVARLEAAGVPVVKRYASPKFIHELFEEEDQANREGYVVRFASGFRVKLKFDEYSRLHRLLTGVSPKVIWECLQTEDGIDDLIEGAPDEYMKWVKATATKFRADFREIEQLAQTQFAQRPETDDRSAQAGYFKT